MRLPFLLGPDEEAHQSPFFHLPVSRQPEGCKACHRRPVVQEPVAKYPLDSLLKYIIGIANYLHYTTLFYKMQISYCLNIFLKTYRYENVHFYIFAQEFQ